MRQKFIKVTTIGNPEDVLAIYDITKISYIKPEGETKLYVIIDGLAQIWDFVSSQDRDRNFKEIIEIIDKLNASND